MKTHSIRIEKFGGPEVLRYVETDLPEPGPGEARIRHSAIGVNFIDTYHRSGLYPVPLPSGLGSEAAGVVEAVGEGVREVRPGERVAYTGAPPGAYALRRNYPAARLVPLPDDIDDVVAAAALLKGLTAWYLLFQQLCRQAGRHGAPARGGRRRRLAPEPVGAGAGRHGDRHRQHCGKSEALARAQGCAQVLMAGDADIPGQVRSLTGGVGVVAVYDSVGRDTFFQSLDCLRPHGVMVSFGNASGPVEPFAPAELAKRHSLYVTRPILFDFIETRAKLLAASGELFERLADGSLRVQVGQRYALADAATAHRDLEGRRTTGSTVLLP